MSLSYQEAINSISLETKTVSQLFELVDDVDAGFSDTSPSTIYSLFSGKLPTDSSQAYEVVNKLSDNQGVKQAGMTDAGKFVQSEDFWLELINAIKLNLFCDGRY